MNLKFTPKANGTNNPGILDYSNDPPTLFCYCTERISQIIIKALQPKPTIIVTIQEREERFRAKLHHYFIEYGAETVNEFSDYWCEYGENDKKMRFEKEKAFDISKRLARWKKNEKPKNEKAVIGRQGITTVTKNASNWQ